MQYFSIMNAEVERNIILIGMPGAGKSTVGVLLAKVLSMDFVDTDLYIQAREKRRLQEIIDQDGLQAFRRMEARHIRGLVCRHHVIATGGSVVYDEAAMRHLGGGGVVVHLDLPLEGLKSRLTNLSTRGVVMAAGQSLENLYAERQPLYQRYAQITIDCAGLTHEEVVARICEKVDGASRPVSSTDTSKVDGASRPVSLTDTSRDGSSTLVNYFDPFEPIGNLNGNLPHWRQEGVIYFVTFRLADSLPQERLSQWLAEREEWIATHPEPHDEAMRAEYYRLFPERLQNWLDAGHGSCILARPEIKKMVEASLNHFNGARYRLLESVVMPNHVHVLVAPQGLHTLSGILHSWKSYTAHEILKKVDRASRPVSSTNTSRDGSSTGVSHVWQQESFDHIVRNAAHLERIRQYIRDNPTKVDGASRPVSSIDTSRDGSSTQSKVDGASRPVS